MSSQKLNLSKLGNNTVPTLIRQPYVVTMSKHRLNVHEMRIMFRIVESLQEKMAYGKQRQSVQQNLFGDTIINIPTSYLIPENSKNHACVKRALKTLEDKSINIKGKDEKGVYETNSRLIMKSKYYLNNQMVELQLDRDLLPSYLALANNYSQYVLEVAFNSSSPYTMKLYQFISHWKDKKRITVKLDDLRDLLQLENKYQKPKDLRKFILEPVAKDLKERADVWYELKEPIKTGRSITGYTFKIFRESINDGEYHREGVIKENIKQILTTLFKFRDYHLKQLEPILKHSALFPHIRDKIQDITVQMRKSKIKNIAAYVITVMKNEFKDYFESDGDDSE